MLLVVYNMFEKHQRSQNWCKERCINYRIMMRAVEVRNQLRGYLKYVVTCFLIFFFISYPLAVLY